MADMLKFRKGRYEQIKAADKAAGTIYIATDEKAMYVDIDASTRIRIGDFIRVASIEDIPKPYSETAVYYVEGANALLGYKDGKWKQINGTEELVTRIDAIEDDVDALKGVVGSATSGLVKQVAALETLTGNQGEAIQTNANDIEALKAAIGMNEEGDVEGLAGSVVQLRTDLTELETEVHGTDGNGGIKGTLADHQSRISALEGKDVALKSDVAAAKSAVLGQADGVDFNGTVKGAYNAAATAQNQADKGVADAAAAKAIADANTENLSALAGRVNALDQTGTGRVAILEGKVDTLEKAGYATVGQVNTAKSEVLGTEADAAGATTVHGALKAAAAADAKAVAADEKAAAAQGDITTFKTEHANDYTNTKINELVADAKKAGTDAQTTIDNWKQAHNNDYTNSQIDDKVKTVQDKVDEHTSTLSGLTGENGSVAAAKAAADAAQEDIDTWAQAHANDYTNSEINELVADAKKAGTDASAAASANAGLISGHEGRIAAIEADYLVQKDLDDAKAELSAEIDADINAANAMTFKGTVGSESDFEKITEAKIGDTYVVSAAFGNYKAGDFLIAKGEENEVTGNIINIDWNHVKSGYDASLDQKLTGADNKIKLSTGAGLEGTAVAFAATGSASVTVASNTVTIGMVWEDFD